MRLRFTKHLCLALLCCVDSSQAFGQIKEVDPSLSRDARQILSDNCYSCHGPDAKQREGDLRLDTREGAAAVLALGDSQEALESELLQRILSDDDDLRMPPAAAKKTLTADQKEVLRRWVKAGAPWANHWSFEPLRRPSTPLIGIGDATRAHGGENRTPTSPRNWIDAFIQAKLEDHTLQAADEADRRTLMRRVTLDLTGLPPTPEQVDNFLNDPSPLAYERYVDELLHSPAYGERMAWDWLDAARYADTNGYQGDRERTMWPWRDWVIGAFNEGLPFDDFTVWQLAGDMLPDPTFQQRLATGFCRNHMINGEGGRIPEENRVDYVMDMTETMGTVWLGLTLNCCRCHDHKFDPVKQQEYYQFFAFFNQTPVTGGGGDPQMKPIIAAPSSTQRLREQTLARRLADAKKRLVVRQRQLASLQAKWEQQQRISETDTLPPLEILEPWRNALAVSPDKRTKEQQALLAKTHRESDSQHQQWAKQVQTLEKQRGDLSNSFAKVMVMQELEKPRKTFILDRGLYNKPLTEVWAGVPEALPRLHGKGVASAEQPASSAKSSERRADRLALAEWLVSDEHPLTSRVTVNRIWQHLFGIGLVKTTEDFGVQGEIPLHLELLDALAWEFRESGWDTKTLMRLIVTSHTYRQSSRVSKEAVQLDPQNRRLARGPRYRLPSWMLRDQALAAAGLLVREQGGPSVNTYQPAGVWEEATFGKKKYTQDHGAKLYRRSLYTFWRRIIGPTMFFDAASRQTCTVKMFRTNTPLHALLTLNDVTYVEAARVLAERALTMDASGGAREATSPDDRTRLDWAMKRLVARAASDREAAIFLPALDDSLKHFEANPADAKALLSVGEHKSAELNPATHAAWTTVCLALLNLDETLTKE